MSASRSGRSAPLWALGGALVAVATWALMEGGGPLRGLLGRSVGPVLQVDRDRIDVGEVPVGAWVEARFALTNAGDRRLQLSRAPYVEAVAGC